MKKILKHVAIIAFIGLTSCKNLTADLNQECSFTSEDSIPQDFVKITGYTFDGMTELTPNSDVFKPGRIITISDFYICNHEVTQKEYETYCLYGNIYSSTHNIPERRYGKGDNYPVYDVSWYDSLVYCNKRSMDEGLTPCYTIRNTTNPDEWGWSEQYKDEWDAVTCNFNANGYRLPTEAEWEYCARAKNMDSYTYSGSNTIGDVAWYSGNCGVDIGYGDCKTHEVKTKAPNSIGLYDMSGNILEWCWDWWGEIANDTPSFGASSGTKRVLRGGCWWDCPDTACTVSARTQPSYSPSTWNFDTGFRVVRSAK